MARTIGASLVGMSTVLEAIAARHLGAEVLGLSLVSNLRRRRGGVGRSATWKCSRPARTRPASLGVLLATILPVL